MTGQNATLFIVDDDESVLRSIARLLNSAGYQVQTFNSAQEFLERGQFRQNPACVILDVQMPGLSGLDLQSELQKAHAPLAIVFITGHGDIPTSVRAIKGGALDFLTKPVNDADLLRAVESALARAAADHAHRAELDAIRQLTETLTPRERDVMALVVAGRLNKQIAGELGTVEKTVKVHRARVMEKMKVRSLAELVSIVQKLSESERQTT